MSSSQCTSEKSSLENPKSIKPSEAGKTYENLSFALLARRGYELSKANSKFRNFSVGRDVDLGKDWKFGDILFSYVDEDDTKNLIFIEIKHKLQDDFRIDSQILSAEATRVKSGMQRQFNLQKYFISYLSVREELKHTEEIAEELRNGKIKYIAIFTNIGLNTEGLNSNGFRLKEAPYDIINLLSLNNSIPMREDFDHCYQLSDISESLRKIFKKSSDLHRLARELAQCVVWKNYRENLIMGINKTPIKYYHVALEREVIQKSDQVENKSPEKQMQNKRYCEAQFRDDFVENDEPGPRQKLRDAMFEAIREMDESKKDVSDDELKSILKDVKWKLADNFGKPKPNIKNNLPCEWMTVTEEDITDFLKRLVFIVNQPRVTELQALFQATVTYDAALRQIMQKRKDVVNVDALINKDAVNVEALINKDAVNVDAAINKDAVIVDSVINKDAVNADAVNVDAAIIKDAVIVDSVINKNAVNADAVNVDAVNVDAVINKDAVNADAVINKDAVNADAVINKDAVKADAVINKDAAVQRKRSRKVLQIKFKGNWITGPSILKCFVPDQPQNLTLTDLATAVTLTYESEIKCYGTFSKLENTRETLNRFLLSNNQILCITTSVILLSSIKMLQSLDGLCNYRAIDGRISVNFDILKCKIIRDDIVKSFELGRNNLLTIECRHSIDEHDIEEFYYKLSKVVRNNPPKKIILIVQQEVQNILSEKFKKDFQNNGQFILKSDVIDLNDFGPMEDPLKKKIIVFQGQKQRVSLAELIGIESWDFYSQGIFPCYQEIIDVTTLVTILNDDEIEIGSKPLGTSNLAGAYATLCEEVNTETLANKLLSKESDDNIEEMYIMSGISGSSEEEKIEKLIKCLRLTSKEEIIEDQLGDIGSDSKIQLADDQFDDEAFKAICQKNPEKEVFWIDIKEEKQLLLKKPLLTDSAYISSFEKIDKQSLANKLLCKIPDSNANDIYIVSGLNGSNRNEKIVKLTKYLAMTNKERIEKQLGNIGSKSRIQITDEQFKDGDFKDICQKHPEKKIFWIDFIEDEQKFFLQKFYNSNFYLERKFKNVVLDKDMKQLLMDDNLAEIFIFSPVNDLKKLIASLDLTDENEKSKIIHNYKYSKNPTIKICISEDAAMAAFKELCRENRTVHRLKFEENKLVWCDSHGSVNNLRKYIDDKESEIPLIEENNLIKEIKNKKMVIIADGPGTGKTTTIIKLYESKHESRSFIETHWVVNLNLMNNIQAIKDVEFLDGCIDIVSVVNFLSKVDVKLNNNLAKCLLRTALDKNKNFSKPFLLVLDGFDEVLDEFNRNKIIALLKFLRNDTTAKLWITTRPQYKDILEKELSSFAIQFNPIDRDTQFTYIKMYLRDRSCLILDKDIFNKVFSDSGKMSINTVIQKFLETFLNKTILSFKTNVRDIIGTLLGLHLMLEGSVRHLKCWIENINDEYEINYLGKDPWEVYKNFVSRIYEAYFKKINIREHERQREEKFLLNMYCKELAIALIFKLEPKSTLKAFQDKALSARIITSNGSNIEFIHTSCRDYFASKVFIHWMKEKPNKLSSTNKQEYILKEVLKRPDFQLIRTFIDIKLKKISESLDSRVIRSGLPKEITQHYGEILEKFLSEEQSALIGEEVLHIAVEERNLYIIRFLLHSLKGYPHILEQFLFTHGKRGTTTNKEEYISKEHKKEYILKEVLKRPDFKIIRTSINLKLMISAESDMPKEITQHYGEIIEKLVTEEQSALIGEEGTVLHIAIKERNLYIACFLLNSLERHPDVLRQFLFTRGKHGATALHLACRRSYYEIVSPLLDAAGRISEATLQEFLNILDDNKLNALDEAVCKSEDVRIVNELLKRANNKLDLIVNEKKRESSLILACQFGKERNVKAILNAAKDVDDDNFTLEMLLLNCVSLKSDFFIAEEKHLYVMKALLKTATSLGIEKFEKFIFDFIAKDKTFLYVIVENSDILKIFEEDKYHCVRQKIMEMFDSIPLKERQSIDKKRLIKSIRRERKAKY